ncbi:MAG: hypothetical protein ACREJ2_04385 [Planctomycetota bacterium]
MAAPDGVPDGGNGVAGVTGVTGVAGVANVEEAQLSAYLDGELPAAEQATVEQNLHASAAAQAQLQDLKEVSTLLRTWDGVLQNEHPSQQFSAFVSSGGQSVSADLRAAALEEDPIPIAPVVLEKSRRSGWLLVVAAAVVALAIYLALHFWVFA